MVSSAGGEIFPIIFYIIITYIFKHTGFYPECYDTAELIRGWCIPIATDISLSWASSSFVFGPTHPAVNFLLLVAILDDAVVLILIAVRRSRRSVVWFERRRDAGQDTHRCCAA
jgi:Na+/H+ antiporter NhaA